MTGRTIAHFEIRSKLGQGGMGVVYKARDLHLDRPVAVKVLTADAVANPERKRRFVQEAKAASALNHPNIITVYDIASADGVDYIAMEYVDGKTLASTPGPGMPLSEALPIAIQIAEALSKAHSAGIIHRDLKPANIMVTADGLVKVLDFGLAKLTESDASSDATMTGTEPGPRTEGGMILGTAGYMSPEQAQGLPVDARSDIFSFGAVLYELISGRPAFRGDTKLATLSAVLNHTPPAIAGVPRDLEKILTLCLRKEPKRRFQHMEDVKVQLDLLREESESGTLGPVARPLASKRNPGLLFAAVALLVVAAAGGWYWLRPPAAITSARGPVLTRLTSDSGLTADPALSPDGKLLAYASDRGGGNLDIWVQQIGGGQTLRLTNSEADEKEPSFSPDGTKIAYRTEQDGGAIQVISTLGGESRRIARGGRRPRFSPDGQQIAYWVGGQGPQGWVVGRLFIAPAAGGTPREVPTGLFSAYSPEWSPDGRSLVFWGFLPPQGASPASIDWWVAPQHGGKAEPTGVLPAIRAQGLQASSSDAALTASNHLVFTARLGDATNLWRIPLTPGSWKAGGMAQQLTFGPGPDRAPTIAGTGRLAFSTQDTNADVWQLPLDLDRGVVSGPVSRMTQDLLREFSPAISQDGRRLFFLTSRREIRMKDMSTGQATTVAATGNSGVHCSVDGSTVYYTATEAGKQSIHAATLSGDDQKLCDNCRQPSSISPDGKKVLWEPLNGPAVMMLTVGRPGSVPVIKHSRDRVFQARFSPDGRWVAFHSIPSPAARQVFIAPFRGETLVTEQDFIPVTDGTTMDRYTAWSSDGNLLYFLSEREGFRCIWSHRLDPATKRPVGEAKPVYHSHHARLSLLSTGDPVNIGFSAAAARLIFSMNEETGNIWMTE